MSERELRELVETAHTLIPAPRLFGKVYAVLADVPDVVKAARSFRQQSKDAVATGSITAAHYADFCIAAWHQLEKDFGFRLIDDGWEWTDEDDGYQDPLAYMDRPDCMP